MFEPLQAYYDWSVTRMTVQSDAAPLVPTVKVYRGAEDRTRLVDGSNTGTLDHSDTNLVLRTGEALVFVFEDATPGTQCTAIIEGKRQIT